MKIVSVVIPTFNEENCVDVLLERLGKVDTKEAYQAEFLEVLQ
jgi:glycosyltransferase involved in cell wall biosynthesis